jgi:hypothetical protein
LANDWYTKLVLTVLAVSVAVLAAQSLQGGTDSSTATAEEGRFRLQVLPMGRLMLKIDSETGQTWRAKFPDPTSWMEIADSMTETLDDAAPTPAADAADAADDEPAIALPDASAAP